MHKYTHTSLTALHLDLANKAKIRKAFFCRLFGKFRIWFQLDCVDLTRLFIYICIDTDISMYQQLMKQTICAFTILETYRYFFLVLRLKKKKKVNAGQNLLLILNVV